MNISVIIPTYNRPKELLRCLEGLRQQSRLADEILVVIRSKDEKTQQILEKVDRTNLPLKTVIVQKSGQVIALNAALEQAKGYIISFIDDDTVPLTHWLERLEAHFKTNPCVGGVGGRDRYHYGEKILDGKALIVGRLFWFGLLVGNHHLGSGPPRKVDHLKGANMSYRRTAIKDIRFDERLKESKSGVEYRNDTAFSLAVKNGGWKLIYDPEVTVDHYLAVSPNEDKRNIFDIPSIENIAHNETIAILSSVSWWRKIIFFFWVLLIGNIGLPGIVLLIRAILRGKKEYWLRFLIMLKGRWEGWKTWHNSLRKKRV